VSKLKILVWNLQDLFIFVDKRKDESISSLNEPKWQQLSSSLKPNKPLEKIKAIATLIDQVSPDICLFTEAGGKESLNNLNSLFLNDKFIVVHHKSNSDRGIDLGVLIQKTSSLNFTHKFHNHSVFARGILELKLTINNNYFHFLLTHLKSKLNLKGVDFEGRKQRKREVAQIVKVAEKILLKKNTHVAVTGDLNGIISKDTNDYELDQFATNLGLIDCLEHLNHTNFDRATYLYYNKQREAIFMQLDYFLMDKNLAKMLDNKTKVLDFSGAVRTNYPKNYKEKIAHPSDHYPLYVELNLDSNF
jgi:endonuclease/exonuclease/phosphatase family metal-dependent hydrolase